jgi:hypothetical protein
VKERVFVLSIPDYGYTPFGKNNQPQISAGIDAFNAVNKSIAEKLGVAYVNITDISRNGLAEPDLVAPDGLHPSGKMYSLWVERILKGATISEGSGDNKENEPNEVTGVEDVQFGVQLYPNPFDNKLTVQNLLYLEQPVTISIVDSKGAVALQQRLLQIDMTEIDTTSLQNGAYICQVEERDGRKFTAHVAKGVNR